MDNERKPSGDPEKNIADEIVKNSDSNSCWKSVKKCDVSGVNTHEMLGSLAAIATVISGIVAVLIVFLGGNSD